MGKFRGRKFPPQDQLCNRTHRGVRLCKIHFLYQEKTEAVSLKLTNFIPSTSGVSSKFSSKNAVNPSFTLNFGTLWHNVTRLPASIFGGISGENHRLRGKNGEFWMPSSQSPNGNQTIIPIDLETLKYSRNLPFFKSNGEIPGKKIPSPRPIM